MSRTLRRALAAMAMTALTVLALAGPAAAHSSQLESSPKPGAVLDQAPTEVSVRFDSPLMDVGAAVVVRSADGIVVSTGTPRISHSSIAVDVRPDAAPGRYVVAYRVVSQDGHTVTSTFDYTVRGEASLAASPPASRASDPPTATPSVEPAATSSSSGPAAADPADPAAAPSPLVIGILALAAAVVLAALAAAIRAARRR